MAKTGKGKKIVFLFPDGAKATAYRHKGRSHSVIFRAINGLEAYCKCGDYIKLDSMVGTMGICEKCNIKYNYDSKSHKVTGEELEVIELPKIVDSLL